MLERLKAWPFYFLQHHAISWLMYVLARIRFTPLKNLIIRSYTAIIDIDMSEAVVEERFAYASLNAFFTREIMPERRPFADEPDLLCPVDGAVSQAGTIHDDRIFQAKGHEYTLHELLAGDSHMVERFRGGRFATLYLSPRDYHRIHMPETGKLKTMRYVPGRLFSVATHTVNHIPRLFARNERVVCHFDTGFGDMAMILVGAINVSAIETVWHGLVKGRGVTEFDVAESNIELSRGEEMGRFNLGSTVIVLLPDGMEWDASIRAGEPVRLGQALARQAN